MWRGHHRYMAQDVPARNMCSEDALAFRVLVQNLQRKGVLVRRGGLYQLDRHGHSHNTHALPAVSI